MDQRRKMEGLNPWRAEARALWALGWPIVLTNLAQMAITTTDVVMSGWLGPEALAAGSLGANLFYVLFVIGIGLATATAPMLAHTLGRARNAVREARRTVRQGFWMTAALTLPCWAVLWQGEAILLALGQEPALAAQGGAYLRALQWGLLPALWFMVLRSFVAALERPRAALAVTLAAVLLNAFTNWVLMFGNLGAPALGLVGAGISSTIANSFQFLALLGYVLWDRRFRRFHLLGHFWRADWPRFVELARIGVPIGLTILFEVSVFNAAVFLMGLLGTVPLAAHAIAIQLASTTFMVPLGIGQAATVRVGLAAGRGARGDVARAGWTALAMGVGFMAGMAAVFLLAPGPLIAAFLDEADPGSAAVAALAVRFLAVAGLFQIVDGAQAVGAGALRGLKDTRVPMLYAGTGYWLLGLPLGAALAFGAGLGGIGIWIGLAAGLAVVALMMVGRWRRRARLGLAAPAV